MENPRLVFLSDIHIGVGAPTNWYQRDLHEPYLLAILDYLHEQADSIAELVLLGDLVDQWTYLPDVQPPSTAEIAAQNPALFAAGSGALPKLLAALRGRMTYLPGNHDMAVSAADFAALWGDAARGLRFVTDPIYVPEAGQGRLACTHGHIFSPFNAPDLDSDPRLGLPLGHFITRLTALYAAKQLAPGQTVADLPISGDPTGAALLNSALHSAVREFVSGSASLSRLVLEAFLGAVQADSGLSVVMADGGRITVAEAIAAYEGFYERWNDQSKFPIARYGRAPGLVALTEVDVRNDLSHFASILGSRHDVVVMGHTHAPMDQAEHPLVLAGHTVYANPGFGCPSRPDLARSPSPAHVTFVEVEVQPSGFAVAVRYVTGERGSLRVASEPLWPAKLTRRLAPSEAGSVRF